MESLSPVGKPNPFGLGRVPLIPPFTPAPKPPEISNTHNRYQNIPLATMTGLGTGSKIGQQLFSQGFLSELTGKDVLSSSNNVNCKDNQNLGLSLLLLEEILADTETNTAKSKSNKWRVESGGTTGKGRENPKNI